MNSKIRSEFKRTAYLLFLQPREFLSLSLGFWDILRKSLHIFSDLSENWGKLSEYPKEADNI